MKKIIIISSGIIAAILITIIVLTITLNKSDYKKNLQFAEVKKGDIRNTISCTGTINAKGTVEIGTQVSGTVSKVFVNYNDNVKKNQILAVLDTSLLEIAVQGADADLIKANTAYDHSLKEYQDNMELYNNKLISKFELDSYKVASDSAYAAKLSAESNLKKAKANLQYAYIRSPINGTVIDKDVEEGQTVAASLSTPTLFIIAENIVNMEINALVDESDIGKIKVNQKATFTVESYPDEEFSGVVREIRMKPTTVSNVVNYTVMIDAKNEKKILLPGMTATIEIITDEKKDVLIISSSATRFKPTTVMMKDFLGKKRNNKMSSNTSIDLNNSKMNIKTSDNKQNLKKNFNDTNFKDAFEKNLKEKNMVQLWYLDNNKLKMMLVVTGTSDTQNTELIEDSKIKPGMKFITGLSSSKNKTTTTANSSSNNKNSGGPPPFHF